MNTIEPIRGSIPAVVTPFATDGKLDLPAFCRILDWLMDEGCDAIVVAGTTGESPTITAVEQALLIETAVVHAKERVPIIAGTGANSTAEAIELARIAKRLKATAHLSVVPYYNKPSQEGLYQHFKKIAEAVDLPMIVYNVPGRTVADISNETMLRLSEVRGIVGIKDATGDIERGTDLLRRVRDDFLVYSGDDATALALTLLGGDGVISVTANAAPRLMHQMMRAALAGDVALARDVNFQLIELHRHLFVEPNPTPLKWVMGQMGLLDNVLRLPLLRMSPAHERLLKQAMNIAQIAATAHHTIEQTTTEGDKA